jgi:hypothetical protein
MYDMRKYSISDLAEPFSISRPAVYRIVARAATPVNPKSGAEGTRRLVIKTRR